MNENSNNMLSAVAVDDEPMALEVIKKFLVKVPYIKLSATFTRSSKAIEYLQKEKVDLLFLDIKMPDISGTNLLQLIADPPMVIFTTAHSRHAVESFELNAIDYLLKPFSAVRFLKACSKALEQIQLRRHFQTNLAGPPAIFVKNGYEQIRILLDDILYVEGSGNYVQFILTNRKILSRMSLREAERSLPASAFIRVHRSFIISQKHISRIENNLVWINNISLPVSSRYANMLQGLKDQS